MLNTNTNDVMGVNNPITNRHNNIDDLSFFDFAIEKRPLFFENDTIGGGQSLMNGIVGKHVVIRSDTN